MRHLFDYYSQNKARNDKDMVNIKGSLREDGLRRLNVHLLQKSNRQNGGDAVLKR